MSRYRIAEKPNEIVVGWDRPLNTFFVQVFDKTKDEDEALVLWLGTQQGELGTVEALEAALASYGVLTPEMQQQLEADMLEDAGYPIIGYIFDKQGMHSGQMWIQSRDELDRFIAGPVCQARRENREVRITDEWDRLIYHFENGKVVWPC